MTAHKPVFHLVEDAEEKFARALGEFDRNYPRGRREASDSWFAFRDRLRTLGIDNGEIERRRLKVLQTVFGSKDAIALDIEFTLADPPSTDATQNEPAVHTKPITHRQKRRRKKRKRQRSSDVEDPFLTQLKLRQEQAEANAKKRAQDQITYERELERLRRADKEDIQKRSADASPASIKSAYFDAFPEKITVLDICWAARQRYREWVRWTGGQLKAGSKPDKAFRAVLTSRKRPEEYRSEPRPKGWK